ncbi:MAG: hypothetical protein COA43_03935 [Robiginitomaculum sp.]|nr:MAG: hypothetical protein COA43_03935 [Robiginitomaculum sp.]
MSVLTEEDVKYFVEDLNKALTLDLSNLEVEARILEGEERGHVTAQGGKYTLKYHSWLHHSDMRFRFAGPDYILEVSAESRMLGDGEVLTSPRQFIISDARFTQGGGCFG